jgi:hypothetical protein
MITQKIVLVLGAGASMPFGFPSGADLKTEITARLIHTDRLHSLLIEGGFESSHTEDFRTALLKSGKRSVDAFLEHRAEFLEVGKAASACALLPREREDYLFRSQASWYDYFFNKLNARFEDFDRNSVSVLTFNYDRSLEHYLFTALKNAYGKTSEECVEALRSIPIVHLYGQLGELPPLASDGLGISYGSPVTVENLRRAASGIKIIHEAVTDEEPFKQAHALLGSATRVCFLGFGYAQTNLQRLMGYSPPTGGPEVLGSALGFTSRECSLIRSEFQALGFNKVVSLQELFGEVLPFLRHYCPFD